MPLNTARPAKICLLRQAGGEMGLPPLPPGAPEASWSLPQIKRFEQNLRSIAMPLGLSLIQTFGVGRFSAHEEVYRFSSIDPMIAHYYKNSLLVSFSSLLTIVHDYYIHFLLNYIEL